MTSSCDRFRELLVAEAAGGEPWSQPVDAHLHGCGECASWADRLRLHRRALAELRPLPAPEALEERVARGLLPEGRVRRAVASLAALGRRTAPEDLEGRVVAAVHGGFRQDRAVEELSTLEERAAPVELDQRFEKVLASLRDVGVLPQPRAPQELEERIDHDLRDLPGTLTRRFLGRLPRLRAPAGLSRRVDDGLREPGGRIVALRRWPIAAGVAAAAGLVLWIGGPGPSRPDGGPRVAPFGGLEIEHVGLADLSGFARHHANLVTDGAIELSGTFPDDPPVSAEPGETETHAGPNRPPAGATSDGAPTPPAGGSPPTSSAGRSGAASRAPGSSTRPGTTTPGARVALSGSGPPFLDRVPDAPFVTAYRGLRHVLVRFETGPLLELEILEEVASDGQGNFTIEVRDVLKPWMLQGDKDKFAMLQSNRVGFSYRFRDFRIRDLERFWANYEVVDTGAFVDVAGRTCAVLEALRTDGKGNVFTLWIDPLTGLLMQQEERRRDGAFVRAVWFETFQLDADLSDLQLDGGPSRWVDFDPGQLGILGFPVLRPSAPPSGFAFERAAQLARMDPSGAIWVQFAYGDGAEQAFFLHSDLGVVPDGAAKSDVTGDRVWAARCGAWTVVEGHIRGNHVISVGKVDENELLLMMQSAVE